MMTPVSAYLQAHRERFLAELVEFVRIPSVSTDPAYAEHVQRAAAWVADKLNAAGPLNARVIQTDGHPIVYGEWLGRAGAPTIIVYGHYDVQPPDPLDLWTTPAFEPTVRDGRLYGRGVSDDKGPMLIPIKVAEAFFATTGGLPVNVRFLFEGEEESGSVQLDRFIRERGDLLGADFVLSADGAMWRIDEPSITVASRGLAGLELIVRGANKDLHSGRYGGAVANAAHALARLISSLHDDEGRVAVAGFYDDVEVVSDEERASYTQLGFDEVAYQQSLGVPALVGEPGYTTLERLWIRPTIEVNGLGGGYQGPGGKTVIPSEAFAKITCRLVANQDPDDIQAKVETHLHMHLPPGVTLSVTRDSHGALPYRIPAGHVGLKVAEIALRQVYVQPPLYVRMGGTIPVSESFKRYRNLDTVFFSFSTADEDYHAPNEFLRLHRLDEGLQAWAAYWQALGTEG